MSKLRPHRQLNGFDSCNIDCDAAVGAAGVGVGPEEVGGA